MTLHNAVHTNRVSVIVGISGTTQFLTGSYDKKILKLDLLNLPTIINTFSLHTSVVSAISVYSNIVYSAGNDKVVRIWDHTTMT